MLQFVFGRRLRRPIGGRSSHPTLMLPEQPNVPEDDPLPLIGGRESLSSSRRSQDISIRYDSSQ